MNYHQCNYSIDTDDLFCSSFLHKNFQWNPAAVGARDPDSCQSCWASSAAHEAPSLSSGMELDFTTATPKKDRRLWSLWYDNVLIMYCILSIFLGFYCLFCGVAMQFQGQIFAKSQGSKQLHSLDRLMVPLVEASMIFIFFIVSETVVCQMFITRIPKPSSTRSPLRHGDAFMEAVEVDGCSAGGKISWPKMATMDDVPKKLI